MRNIHPLASTTALLVMLAVFDPSAAYAACTGTVSVMDCPATCNTNCFLNADVQCATGESITLNSGADLDMCGHSIECTSIACNAPMVTMTSNGSKVSNSQSGSPNFDESTIFGNLNPGVDCQGKSQSQVLGIRIESDLGYAIEDCAKVENNVIRGDIGGVFTSGIANSDRIGDNYIDGFSQLVVVSGGETVSVDHNILVMRESEASSSIYGIVSTSGVAVTIENNVIMGQRPVISGSAGNVFSANYCDSNSSDCATCVSNGFCDDPVTPFMFP